MELNPTARLILEASTGLHGEAAKALSELWCNEQIERQTKALALAAPRGSTHYDVDSDDYVMVYGGGDSDYLVWSREDEDWVRPGPDPRHIKPLPDRYAPIGKVVVERDGQGVHIKELPEGDHAIYTFVASGKSQP